MLTWMQDSEPFLCLLFHIVICSCFICYDVVVVVVVVVLCVVCCVGLVFLFIVMFCVY